MIIVIGLIIAFVLIVLFSNPNTKHCRWRRDCAADSDGQQAYKCVACGGRAFTSSGKAPLDCLVNPDR